MPGVFRSLRHGDGGEVAHAPESSGAEQSQDAGIDVIPAPIRADAFGAAGRIAFTIDSDGGRLVDLLNAPASAPTLAESGAEADLDELLIVVAQARVSDPAKRLHRPGRAVEIRVGPWLVEGNGHGPPAADLIGYWMRYRPRFVVITEAELSHAGQVGSASHPALLVNLRMAQSATLHKPSSDPPSVGG